jgi:hypothetical protein
MGYDISTRLANRDKAEEFAKQYGYAYMFDKDSGEYQGDDTPYFRANIWGMGTIRRVLVDLYNSKPNTTLDQDNKFTEVLEKFSWNDGAHVTVADCQYLIDLWNKDKAIDFVIADLNREVDEDPDFLKTKRYDEETKAFVNYTASIDEVVNGRVALCEEFIAYLGIAKELDGCLVW